MSSFDKVCQVARGIDADYRRDVDGFCQVTQNDVGVGNTKDMYIHENLFVEKNKSISSVVKVGNGGLCHVEPINQVGLLNQHLEAIWRAKTQMPPKSHKKRILDCYVGPQRPC